MSGYVEVPLGLLPVDEAATLLLSTAEVTEPTPEYEAVSREIPKRCGFLPLFGACYFLYLVCATYSSGGSHT